MRISRDQSLLLLIDIQQRLAPHIAGHELLIRRADALLQVAGLHGVPRLATEHCPDQIGPVIAPLRAIFATDEVFEKTAFGATDHPQFVDRITQAARHQIIITGMEAHVCVLQTALGLRQHGFDVCIVADAVGSREARQLDRDLALARLREAGCVITGTETLLFEWTGRGNDPHFRHMLRVVKGL